MMKANSKKGFSLVELIVVIAIMAVMVAVLAPSLLQYVERSRAQKDDSAMGEVANAIMLGLSDQKIYDEVLFWTVKDNISCYVDSAAEPTDTNLREVTKKDSSDKIAQYLFGPDARLADEQAYNFAGVMRGLTITFTPTASRQGVYVIGDAVVNAAVAASTTTYGKGSTPSDPFTLKELEASATTGAGKHNYLYNRVRATVGDEITLTSQTYRNSNYTVFIRMGSTGGNSAAGQDAVKVYGQWSGTNLDAVTEPKNTGKVSNIGSYVGS